MSLESWGPKAWEFIHAASFAYPDEPNEYHREMMFRFTTALPGILPCGICRKHFYDLLQFHDVSTKYNSVFDSKNALTRFFVDAHNSVNQRLSKPCIRYDAVMPWYTLDTNVCPVALDTKTGRRTIAPRALLQKALLIASVFAIALLIAFRPRHNHKKSRASAPV